MQVNKEQLEQHMEQQTGFKLEKEFVKPVDSACLFSLYVKYLMWNAELDEAQTGIKIAGRNINNIIYADGTILMQKVKNN